MRFSIFQAPGKHPLLAFGNGKSKMLFWDLARLTAYAEFMATLKDPKRDKSVRLERPSWLPAKAPKVFEPKGKLKGKEKEKEPSDLDSVMNQDSAVEAATPDPDKAEAALEYGADVIAHWESMYGVSKAHKHPLKPHKTISFTKDLHREAVFIGRQVAWSPAGDWCIVSGTANRVLFFQRWQDKGS